MRAGTVAVSGLDLVTMATPPLVVVLLDRSGVSQRVVAGIRRVEGKPVTIGMDKNIASGFEVGVLGVAAEDKCSVFREGFECFDRRIG